MERLMRTLLSRIGADNDQDRMEMREWWASATVHEKLRVWGCIQRKHDNPTTEIMSRFAQLAFAEMAEAEYGASIQT